MPSSSASAAERILVSWSGSPPGDAYPISVASLGSFEKQPQLVNGHPCYAHEGRDDVMLWFSPTKHWMIGPKAYPGRDSCQVFCNKKDVPLPENITGGWMIRHRNKSWLPTDAIKVTIPPSASTSDTDVTITGARTREERDAEGRKRAIDVESEQERKKAKTALETRVAEARSLCDATIDKRAHVLTAPAFEDYMSDKIDEDELKRRKKAAREQAAAEHESLSTLDKAYGAYTAATAARVAAEKALESALEDEDEAAEKVEEAVLAIQAAAAGRSVDPSGRGMVKSETV